MYYKCMVVFIGYITFPVHLLLQPYVSIHKHYDLRHLVFQITTITQMTEEDAFISILLSSS